MKFEVEINENQIDISKFKEHLEFMIFRSILTMISNNLPGIIVEHENILVKEIKENV